MLLCCRRRHPSLNGFILNRLVNEQIVCKETLARFNPSLEINFDTGGALNSLGEFVLGELAFSAVSRKSTSESHLSTSSAGSISYPTLLSPRPVTLCHAE
ncbi:unnamed protein product [Prunus brigantina]